MPIRGCRHGHGRGEQVLRRRGDASPLGCVHRYDTALAVDTDHHVRGRASVERRPATSIIAPLLRSTQRGLRSCRSPYPVDGRRADCIWPWIRRCRGAADVLRSSWRRPHPPRSPSPRICGCTAEQRRSRCPLFLAASTRPGSVRRPWPASTPSHTTLEGNLLSKMLENV